MTMQTAQRVRMAFAWWKPDRLCGDQHEADTKRAGQKATLSWKS